MNLRLRPDAEEALRVQAEQTGRSQQDLLREAVDRFLGLLEEPRPATDADALMATGFVRPPRSQYRKVRPSRTLSVGSSLDLLDRDDRI
jgi:predicted DNA-binding protein